MSKVISFFLLFCISTFSYASDTCRIPKGEYLTVGCSTYCKYFYRRAIYKAARHLGYPVKIVNIYNEKMDIDFNAVDAIINPGGADIDPKYYKGKVEEELKKHIESLDYLVNYSSEGQRRDPFEYKMWQEYFSMPETKDLPILGICRGMQMMAVSQNIPLYIDIKKELGIRNRKYVLDRIHVEEDAMSRIQQVLGFNHFWAYKQHHQGVRVNYFQKNKQRWPHLKIGAYSHNKKIAESIEANNRLALGVQFHPEMDWWKERLRIFSWLLKKGCENKVKKILKK